MTSTSTNWTINVSDIRTVKVSNVSPAASEQDIKEFLSFSGDILHVEMQRENESSQAAFVTFKDSHGADTAILLSGATILERPVTITQVDNYKPLQGGQEGLGTVVRRAEEAVSTVLAKGVVFVKMAKAFDEQHHWAANASAAVGSLEQRMGLREKLSYGGAAIRGVDGRFQVSDKARTAGAVIMSSQYVSSGVSWISGALGAVTKAAGEVAAMTKDKVDKAEEEKTEMAHEFIDNYARIHLDDVFEEDGPSLAP